MKARSGAGLRRNRSAILAALGGLVAGAVLGAGWVVLAGLSGKPDPVAWHEGLEPLPVETQAVLEPELEPEPPRLLTFRPTVPGAGEEMAVLTEEEPDEVSPAGLQETAPDAPQVPVARPPVSSAPAMPQPKSPAEPDDQAPAVALIIDDIGPNWRASQAAITFDRPLTLSFLPYAQGIGKLVRSARAQGHEIFLHLPMEPLGEANPGPNALLSDLSGAEFERRLRWSLAQIEAPVGVNNHMGSRLTADAAAMRRVMDVLGERELIFVDSVTSSASVAAAAAARAGLPTARRDVFLDHVQDAGAIRRQLRILERRAREQGRAIGIGHPHPVTLRVLADWMPEAEARGIRFVPVASLVDEHGCIRAAGCAALAERHEG